MDRSIREVTGNDQPFGGLTTVFARDSVYQSSRGEVGVMSIMPV